MFIDRKALESETSKPDAQLRENCKGCEDCKGTCLDLTQLRLVPELLTEPGEERP